MSRHFLIFMAVVFCGMFLFTGMVWALEPPTRVQLEKYRADGSLAHRIAAAKAIGNHRIAPQLVQRFNYNMQRYYLQMKGKTEAEIQRLLSPPPEAPMPTKGIVKILILPIAFSDYGQSSSIEELNREIFGDGESKMYPFESLRNFYLRSSYGQLEFTGTVLDYYTAPYPRSQVQQDGSGRHNLIIEALSYFDARGHDFSQYDNDGDGVIDYFAVLWTGPSTGWGTFWWGYFTHFTADFEIDGKGLRQYSWQSADGTSIDGFRPETLIHETGHALGLPDYYDYDDSVGPKGGIGHIDIMDSYRGDHNCFSKCLLEWITPIVYSSGSHEPVLRESCCHPDAVIFMPHVTDIFSEYFMVQNRSRRANDTGLPNDGLLVWHVDARLNPDYGTFIYNNSYTEHKLLQLVQADGLNEIEILGRGADAGDYYTAGHLFGPGTRPHSNYYDGMKTYCELSGISESDPTMSCSISVGIHAPIDFTAVRHENRSMMLWEYIIDFNWYPNPANQYFPIELYRLYDVTDGSRTKLVDIPVNTHTYRLRHLYEKNQRYTIVAVTDEGLESSESSVTVE